jgi:clan AA aspartic protease (TIGR02281 family)
VTFGPPELAQLAREAQATIAVAMLSSAAAGIVLGSVIACCNIIRAKRQRERAIGQEVAGALAAEVSNFLSFPANVTDDSGPGGLAEFGRIAPLGREGDRPIPRPTIFPITLFAVAIVLAMGGGILYWHQTSSAPPAPPLSAPPAPVAAPPEKGSEFERVYKDFGIRPLPSSVERQPQVQSRLSQLNREACYTDAIVGLGRVLLDAGYPREAATSLRSFVKRCGSASEVLPYAYTGYERINDFSAALEVANELVEAAPANGTFRYWRALAYDRTGQLSLAMLDYMNTVQLFGDPKSIFGDVFYKWSRTYAALGRYCDAISPIEMYISLDPANRRTPQTVKIISDYAEQGICDKRYAIGTTRVSFVGGSAVRTLTVFVNGVAGNLILDTGATFVSITSQFALKAKVETEPGNQVIIKTVGGKTLAEIGYANSVRVGKAEAKGVVTAVHREDSPFGNRVDGLLGMSFLSRFNIKLSPTAIELNAIGLR